MEFGNVKRFNYIMTEMNAAYHSVAQRLGLSDSAMLILYSICENDGTRPLSEICKSSGLSKQTVGSSLHKLSSDGYIDLNENGRKKTAVLTEKGRKLADKTVMWVIRSENEIYAEWSGEELESYLSLTQRFLDSFREKTANLRLDKNKEE